ncbi:MAG: hypothetical protein O7B99_01170 [Planctomycetota bacterium]|nr:hypothetical protein [Planctomycetota bacterium]
MSRASRRAFAGPLPLLLMLVLGAALDGLACGLTRTIRVPPVEASASMAFAEGQLRLRVEDVAGARDAFDLAASLAPGWVAPERALDDLRRADLLGAEALAARHAELAARPGDAATLYLVGRLEGEEGIGRFEQALRFDADLAWAHHGLAWTSFLAGDVRSSLRHGRRARELARDTWERSYFTVTEARYHLARGRIDRAAELLTERLAEPDVLDFDRVTLGVWLARAELSSAAPHRVERGFQRGIRILITSAPTVEELALLVAAMLESTSGRASDELMAEVGSAVAAREGPGREGLRARLYLQDRAPALALGLLRRAAGDQGETRLANDLNSGTIRAARFGLGEGRAAMEEWLAALPAFVRDADGLPRDDDLRALVLTARDGGDGALGDALVMAGWFGEARALAQVLARDDLDAALAIEERASAGLALLDGIERVLRFVDLRRPYAGPWAQVAGAGEPSPADAVGMETGARPIGSLDDLLLALQPLFSAYHRNLDPGSTPSRLDVSGSPRKQFGGLATLVHPGPTFSESDEEEGLGSAGEPVSGLAAELGQLGRFGVFGQVAGGGGPDGTLLRRVLIERRRGEHFGVAWSGTVAWCDGTDVPSRPGRRGARISGAALHEGYFIDIASVRRDLESWRTLERDFPPDGERAAAALGSRGLELMAGADARERGRLVPLLGASERVRLAVLRDRLAQRGADVPLIDLDELVLVTAIHEEGHLCDRTRFLPLKRNWWKALALFASGGFSPAGVTELLEYRAQLAALFDAPDPRLPFSDCLAAAERGNEVTPHAAAYTEILRDLLEVLAEEVARAPELYAELDGEHYLAHQLHYLEPEAVRALVLELARRKGLVEGG